MNTTTPSKPRILLLRAIAFVSLAVCLLLLAPTASATASGAIQVEGEAVPWPAAPDTCDPSATGPVDYVLAMPDGSGSLVGCLYGIRQEERFNAGGQLQVNSTEIFIGCHGDRCGSFELKAFITSRWDGLPGVGNQMNGRCQHKIVSGTGNGDFAGIEGRLDFKDILTTDDDGTVTSISFDYEGHLRLS